MLLKVVLFARMIGFGNVRSMESLCRHDIRFMYIMKEETPSFMAFERLLKDYLIEDIDHIFFDISQNIGKLMNIDKSVQYIDGTKFEANANKYSFVYKTRIINARRRLFTRRGLRNAKMEFLIVCLGYNLKKYHKYRVRNEKDIKQKGLLN